jgi:septum site-determining protein MinC
MSQAANTTFDIKSASIDLLALILKTDDLDALSNALEQRFGKAGKACAPEAFVVDIEALPSPSTLDLGRLLALLQHHGIKVVGLRHPDAAVASLAAAHKLMHIVESPRSAQVTQPATEPPAETPRATVETTAAPVVQTVVSTAPTMVIDRPVRAGQQIYAKGANLVVLAMVSAGAEIIADGDIHVYAPLRGRALAGARGNTAARIYVRSMEAELVSIAGVYRTLEQALPDSIKGKPTQIFLENERLVMTTLGE